MNNKELEEQIKDLEDQYLELQDKHSQLAEMYKYTISKEVDRLKEIKEDTCHICWKEQGIRVIIFDSFMRGRASSFVCERCLDRIQK